MPSENSISMLRASLIFFLASLMLGSAVMYIQFGIVCVLVAWHFKWDGLKETVPAIINESKPAWVMLLLFTALFTITLLASDIVSFSQIGELKWLIFPLAFGLAFSAILNAKELRTIERIAIVFLLVILIYSTIESVYQVRTGKNFGRLLLFDESSFSPRRGSGLLKNPIPYAHVVGSLFHIGIVGAIISCSKGRRRMAAILSGITLLLFLCLLSSLARGAWLAIALTALFSLIIVPKSFKLVNMIGLGVATVIGICMLASNSSLYNRFLSSFDPAGYSNSVRLQLWRTNLDMLVEHPFGMGFNANDTVLPEKLAELGYPDISFHLHPHNEFLDYAVATGFPGLLLYLGVTIWLLIFTVRLLRRSNLNGATGEVFLLTSSALVQSFLNGCALTDQFTTPGRFLICLAWAVPMAIALKYKNAPPLEPRKGT